MIESNRQELKESVIKQADQSVDTLYHYLRLTSVSAQHLAIPETVTFIADLLKKFGGEVQVLDELGGNPVIYGLFPAGEQGNSERTLLFYNHYDVQPPDPLDEWESEPFEPYLKDGTLYGRGTADNKGSLMQRLAAIKALEETEGLPCNVKFLIEGEEEIGSPGLPSYLKKYADLFQADACIWEFGSKDAEERVELFAGIKGSAYFELSTKSASIDLHSSLAAVVDNPAWRLVQALASMKDQNNNILVEGFFDEIEAADEELLQLVRNVPFDKAALSEPFGLTRPLITEARGEIPQDALMLYPTMTICGMVSGYIGEGAKTVLPKEAKVKLDCRMVPGQTGEHLLACFQRHLLRHGFSDIHIELIESQRAYRSNIHDPFLNLVKQTAEEAYQSDVVLYPNSPGTGPMYAFNESLHLPIVSTGVGWAESKAHAPNESIRMKDYVDGALHMAYLLTDFAAK
ncbi:M20/M25/M40 family metallo-hydrolase [Sporolactobacillus kofuensis]|uniref:M20/M25/M40 family metallo-hydrolase n=1 Tax=Sporolactobacillus kofuensis TaxID=269672 RepID=A0ABW1WFC9_9BACL|nr:M20/M25/M40 family metallo-hydrolase [Sporolactobacillus kofuensis]MCO7174960.1 M20/M25/M40 family metallo-hydrolase [Sporolactobacillus kofuensis]